MNKVILKKSHIGLHKLSEVISGYYQNMFQSLYLVMYI